MNDNHQIVLKTKALEQIELIQKNDFTLEGCSFRVKIDGKGCSGFTYATGFSEKYPEDVERTFFHPENPNRKVTILFDTFTAFYFQKGSIDYLMNESLEEGFVVKNDNETNYQGKFFKDISKIPELKKIHTS